jgi:hypothetical protein
MKNDSNKSNNTRNKYDQKILDKYDDYFNSMLNMHPRFIVKRFDGRAPDDGCFKLTEKHLYRFTDYAMRALKRDNPLPQAGRMRSAGRHGQKPKHPTDPIIMLVKEKTSEERNFHVHGIALVNGQARRDGYYLQQQLSHCWNTVLGTPDNSGLLNDSRQYGPSCIIIDKNKPDFEQKKQQAYQQAKYLAKTKTKELNPKGSWRCSGTRIKSLTSLNRTK